jgi:hypothetical protein
MFSSCRQTKEDAGNKIKGTGNRGAAQQQRHIRMDIRMGGKREIGIIVFISLLNFVLRCKDKGGYSHLQYHIYGIF